MMRSAYMLFMFKFFKNAAKNLDRIDKRKHAKRLLITFDPPGRQA